MTLKGQNMCQVVIF